MNKSIQLPKQDFNSTQTLNSTVNNFFKLPNLSSKFEETQNFDFPKQTFKHTLNPKILEQWLNDTLKEAAYMDIPGSLLNDDHKSPASRYGIDWMQLLGVGLPTHFVERIYRGLFVHSLGFFEIINKCLEHSPSNSIIVTRLWKVFAVLLEYCCWTDYEMMITKAGSDKDDELKDMKSAF